LGQTVPLQRGTLGYEGMLGEKKKKKKPCPCFAEKNRGQRGDDTSVFRPNHAVATNGCHKKTQAGKGRKGEKRKETKVQRQGGARDSSIHRKKKTVRKRDKGGRSL